MSAVTAKNLLNIVIIGRPNVGKSSLFNRLAKRRVAIVHDEPGVTRDCIHATASWDPLTDVRVVDTGGVFQGSTYDPYILAGAEKEIQDADVIFVVVDGQVGVLPLDLKVRDWLFKLGSNKPLFTVVNKCESYETVDTYPYQKMGISGIYPISAAHNRGLEPLMDAALLSVGITPFDPESIVDEDDFFDPLEPVVQEESPKVFKPKIAVIGRPNVGKSTLLNSIIQEERALVSDLIGTTRDAIYVEEEDCIWIDTAGVRKKHRESTVIEKFAAMRTQEAIDAADVCILCLDVTQGVTEHDRRIAELVIESGKGAVAFLNKWDQVKAIRMEHVMQAIRQDPSLNCFLPVIGSAKTGRNVDQLKSACLTSYESRKRRIPTAELNKWLKDLLAYQSPPSVKGKATRISYMTQVSTAPPSFVVFCNQEDVVPSYLRYLENRFRSEMGFVGTPIRMRTKKRTSWIDRK
ncbi:MAG: ribosome biogenesis GTPase Der [Verrucomicrobia bacterium]|nr:ribosome biogenesis GTPase Der [Verrucomicrobiota bacterium]NDE63493.1 ribosome biogenesis GTPase Der [Chlamydiota bacterium]